MFLIVYPEVLEIKGIFLICC